MENRAAGNLLRWFLGAASAALEIPDFERAKGHLDQALDLVQGGRIVATGGAARASNTSVTDEAAVGATAPAIVGYARLVSKLNSKGLAHTSKRLK